MSAKKKHYPDVDANPDFPKLEEQIVTYWKKNDTFKESVAHRQAKTDGGNNEFIFYDGPPFANGLPHYGHLLTGFVKDIFARYQTIKGKRVERRFGWDCHGLPAEMGAEKELGISGRHKIMEYGIDKFNEKCRTSVMKYAHDWEKYVDRQARWVDFKNDYKTMDTGYMESVLWAFKQLYDKGLVYESLRVMPYSWAAETPLSNFETRLDNSYREKTDKAITVAFELDEVPEIVKKKWPDIRKCRLLAWTTTPWTLPSNLALGIGPEVLYVPVLKGGIDSKGNVLEEICYVLAASSLESYKTELMYFAGEEGSLNDGPSFFGSQLLEDLSKNNIGYHPLFPYFAEKKNTGAFRILAGDFIEEGSGTGVVHLAPGFGEDDQRVCEANGIAVVCPVDNSGRYTGQVMDIWTVPVKAKAVYDEFNTAIIAYKLNERPQAAPDAKEYVFLTYKAGPNNIQALGQWNSVVIEEICYLFSSHFLQVGGVNWFFNKVGIHQNWRPALGDLDTSGSIQGNIFILLGANNSIQMTSPVFVVSEDFLINSGAKLQISLHGLNVIAERTKGESDPYDQKQIDKYGLVNLRIIQYLKETNHLIKQEDYVHNYPHCWRTDEPLIYKALPSWYVKVTAFKDRMVELNQQINWIPDHIRDGQFGKWLENARDWSISRNRFWGSPIPIWKSDNPKNKKLYVFGSIKELEEFFKVKVKDLHRPYIDELTAPDPDDKNFTLRRVEDVFDCWFESGSMPYAQVHYPFENKQWFEDHFPADFIVEYVAQTRGWFYTLMVLSTALFDRPPFLNCICHGVVLDDKGQKLSKRLNNYADPMDVFNKFGADAMRWVMVSAPIMHGGELLIDKEGNMVRDAVRLVLKPVWNAYNFFTLYANADGIKAKYHPSSDNLMDRYILAKCKDAVLGIERAMDAYDTPAACKAVEQFFEVLNNWYIRRNKERFWKSEHDHDKFEAYNVLYSVLHIMCRAMSPLLPLLTETIWQGLGEQNSVHLADFPDLKHVHDEAHLRQDMDRVQAVCNAALGVRNIENLRVRQPLAVMTVVDPHASRLADYADLIKDEVNVKDLRFAEKVADFAEHKLKVNFPILGKRLPAKMKDIIAASKQGKWEKGKDGKIVICGEALEPAECQLLLEPKVAKGAQALATNDALVILDLNVTDDLKKEGIARDLVRMIQQSRKEADLHITDRIDLTIETANSNIQSALGDFGDYISEQTLAVSLKTGSANHKHRFEQKLEGADVVIGFSVAA